MNLQITSGPGWNPTNARVLADLSAQAYDESTIECTATDTHVLIVELADCIAIAFRGTKSVENFIIDADFLRTQLEWATDGAMSEVHTGFLKGFESILPALHLTLDKLLGRDALAPSSGLRPPSPVPTGEGIARKPLFICGHSLGGAYAVLAGLELKRNRRYTVHSVYTYGQPRIGNAAFKRDVEYSLGASLQRHVYENDIVARIPHLPSIGDPYRHAGDEIFLPATGRILLNPSTPLLLWNDLRNAWRAWTVRRTGVFWDALQDHHISNYQTALAQPNPPPNRNFYD